MDIRHLKNAEFEPKYQKYKGRVVLRGDIVKDDSGSYVVFTGQGSCASQMTAAKVMDVIARHPDCAGKAADAVSGYSQVRVKDVPTSLKIPSQNVQRYGYVFHDTSIEDPVVPLERKFYGLRRGICEVFKTSWQTGKHLMRDDLENHLKDRTFRSEQWLNISRFLQETWQGSTNLVRKSCQEYSSHVHWLREKSGKEVFSLQTLMRSWKI